jgi:hypothetical protein
MKAGWIFTTNDTSGGENTPYLPPGVGGKLVAPCDIFRITGGPSGNEHNHILVGGIGLPSVDREGLVGEHHYHYLAWYNDAYRQLTIGTTDHAHDINTLNGVLSPDYFLVFWIGSDADAVTINADPKCVIAVQALGVESDEGAIEFVELDDTAWTPTERSTWETRIANFLALDLPDEVTNGVRLVAFFVGALVSRPQQRERWLRMIS